MEVTRASIHIESCANNVVRYSIDCTQLEILLGIICFMYTFEWVNGLLLLLKAIYIWSYDMFTLYDLALLG